MAIRKLVRKKGITYAYQLDIGRDPEGKRKTHTVGGFRTRKACEIAQADEIAKRARGAFVEPSRDNLSVYLATWIAHKEVTVRPATIGGYRIALDRIIPYLGTTPLAVLTPLSIEGCYCELAKTYAASTIRQTHAVFAAALNQAVRWRLIERSPLQGISHLPHANPDPRPIWTAQECRQFLTTVERDADHALWRLLLDTGMRIGEALALTWHDLSLEQGGVVLGRVRIVRTLTRKPQGAKQWVWVVGTQPKTRSSVRTLSLSLPTVVALREHRHRILAITRDDDITHGFVFTRDTVRFMTPEMVTKRLRAACLRAGVPVITPHGIRSTHATLAAEAGIPLKAIADQLGHRNIDLVAELYAQATEDAGRKVSEALARILEG